MPQTLRTAERRGLPTDRRQHQQAAFQTLDLARDGDVHHLFEGRAWRPGERTGSGSQSLRFHYRMAATNSAAIRHGPSRADSALYSSSSDWPTKNACSSDPSPGQYECGPQIQSGPKYQECGLHSQPLGHAAHRSPSMSCRAAPAPLSSRASRQLLPMTAKPSAISMIGPTTRGQSASFAKPRMTAIRSVYIGLSPSSIAARNFRLALYQDRAHEACNRHGTTSDRIFTPTM